MLEKPINKQHSQRDYTGRSLRDRDPAEFSGSG